MKKILIFLVIICIFTSCYDDFRLDNDNTTVAFSAVTGGSNEPGVLWRTVVKDEGLSLDAGVYLAGILENTKERWVDFQIDPSLLVGTKYTLLPKEYYKLSNDKQFVIHAGESIGKVKVILDSIKFLNDPKTITANYAIPFKLIKTSEDSILSKQSTQILVIKYINHQDGFYNHSGNFETFSASGASLNKGAIDNEIMASTFSTSIVETNGSMNLIGPDYKMKLNINPDNTVSLSYSPNLSTDKSPKNIALSAKINAPTTSPWENAEGIHDNYTPANSGDKNGSAYGNWPQDNMWNYVDYEFNGAFSISKSEIYWWSDGGGIINPYNSYLQYWDLVSNSWKVLSENVKVNDVAVPSNLYGNTTAYTIANPGPGNSIDKFNVTTFDAISTTKIRVNFIAEFSQGILEWRVWGVPAAVTLESNPIESITNNGVNIWDPVTSTFTLNYKVKYVGKSYYTNVSAKMKWRNRIRDGVNEWRR